MNKVTLSVVALAAIGAPVQSQAADQTEAEKLQATYDEVCGILNTAINEVNGYHEAVKAEYLNKLSNIQKEIDAAKTAGTIDKAYFDGVISTVKAEAKNRENQYDGYDLIKGKFDNLTSTYKKALTTVQNGSYPNVGAKKKAWLESDELGYPALKARVDALDPATQDDIYNKRWSMWYECSNMNTSVQAMLDGLDKEEANAASSEASYQYVVDEITALKETYNVQLQALLKILPGDPDVYGNWQAKAIDELNEEYRKILDVEKKNAAAREAGNANEIQSDNLGTLAKVKGNIESISDKWKQLKEAEEAAYKARKEDVDTLNKNLKAITDELSMRSLSELDGDINTIQTKINTVASTVESRYKANTVSKLDITKSQTEINNLIKELNKKAQPIIDNYDANARIIVALDAQYKDIEAAKTAADKLSDDGKYKASDYFTASYDNINAKRKAIINAAKNALDTKTSVKYEADNKYKNAMAEVDDLIKAYAAITTASLGYYNAATKTIADAQARVDKIAALADLSVTNDGNVKGKGNYTYQEAMDRTKLDIQNINSSIEKAKTETENEHKQSMLIASIKGLTYDIETLDNDLKNYDANKKAFDKNSAIAAADNMLKEADARINDFDTRLKESLVGDLGNMEDEVKAAVSALQTELEKLTQKVADQKKSYEAAEDDKKQEAAQNTISTLSDVNLALEKLEPKVVEAENLAIKAKNNKAAYDATTKAVTDSSIDGKLVAAQTEIEKKTTGDGQDFYLDEWKKLSDSVTALNTAIGDSYTDKKSAENKESHLNTLNNLLSAISTLQTNAIANETMHSAQVEKAKTLQSDWQKAYTSISEKDESTQAKDYLAQLGTLQDAINALNTNIAKAFATGTSKAKDSEFAAEITRITNEINNIVKAQEEGYNAAITADNIAQHNKFISQYNAAYKMYQDAVAALNEFAKIQNPVLVKALEDLVPTHDAIYEYADKLRLLNADESADYATYKAPKLYSSATWVYKADLYEAEIDAKLKEYQKAVNDIALANYTDEINEAVKKLADAKDAIKDYTYKDKKNAFADVDAFVGDAQTAAGLTGNKEVDRMFATKIDGWLSQFKNVDNMIDADKEAAADNEFTYQHTNFTNLYNSEKAEIAKLANLSTDYLAQLVTRKQSTIDYANDMFVYGAVESGNDLLPKKKFDILPGCLEELNKYYSADGTPADVDKKNHSDIYKKAVGESKYNTANLAAYDEIIAIINGAEAAVDNGAQAIDPLFNVHIKDSKIYNDYKDILSTLEMLYEDAETWKSVGSCVVNKSTAETRANAIKNRINALKNPAIDAEIPALKGEVDRVKEEYNKAATQSADLLEKVKVYDAQIQTLYNTLYATPTKENPNNKGINYKWENERSKYGFDAAKADLVKLQSEISRVGRELTALYDAAAQETALAELNARAEELEALLKDFTEKAEYHKDINDKYGADLDDFKAYLEGVKADVEAKNAAGDILFYKNNLLADFDRAEAEFSYVAGLNAMYVKYLTNDKVFNTLKADFEALQKQLDELKTLADGFHASSIVQIKDPVTGEFVDVEYRNNQYEVISATIKTELNDLAKSHDAIELTDDKLEGATYDVSNSIVEYEKNIKHDEATLCWLPDLQKSYEAANDDFNKDDKLYGGTRKDELQGRLDALKYAIENARNYEKDAFYPGSISYDIDGNDVRVENERTGVKEAIKINYIKEAWPTLEAKINTLRAEAEQLAKDVNELAYIEGDADNDKKVTVNDYSTVRNWILTATAFEDVSESQRYAGDVDGNKQFTVADMTQISNIIFYGNPLGKQEEAAGAKGQLTVVDNDEITLVKESEETSVFGKTVRVAVNVAHNVAFTAGQFDVKLPEGMKIASQSLTERGNGHELLCNEIGNGLYRMVAATIDNTKFNGRTGALVVLDVEVSGSYTGGEISVSNAIFSDANGISYTIVGPGNDGETTGIGGVTAPTVKERIYSIGGQMKKALKKGINIIVGEDGKGHKVVK